MALITTAYSMGWFGVEGDADCSDINLPGLIGTYEMVNGVKTFKSGSAGLTEDQAKSYKVTAYSSMGAILIWNLTAEFNLRLIAPQAISLDTLECGQMYYIYTGRPELALDVPGFYPSALNVDMGRVVSA